MVGTFDETGWVVFPPEPAVTAWAAAARQNALRGLSDPALDGWYQCERTWFVGLEALDNDADGRVEDSAPLSGAAVRFLSETCGGWPPLHKGQISGVFSGYPRPREGETEAGFRYRLNRDAAHVDGVLGLGDPKRRFVQEPHAFILGLPLSVASPDAAPLVVWKGSHRIMQRAFQTAFAGVKDADLGTLDVTEIYQNARRTAFETCPRVTVHGPPGSAYVLHRMALHGVAPWQKAATAAPEGRLVAYFRPPMRGGVRAWVEAG